MGVVVNPQFAKIVVSGQSDVQAETVGDTLTFAEGVNIDISTNPTTDTVTVALSPNVTGLTSLTMAGAILAATVTSTGASFTPDPGSAGNAHEHTVSSGTTVTINQPLVSPTRSVTFLMTVINTSGSTVTPSTSGAKWSAFSFDTITTNKVRHYVVRYVADLDKYHVLRQSNEF
jgi:hypothetical protein